MQNWNAMNGNNVRPRWLLLRPKVRWTQMWAISLISKYTVIVVYVYLSHQRSCWWMLFTTLSLWTTILSVNVPIFFYLNNLFFCFLFWKCLLVSRVLDDAENLEAADCTWRIAIPAVAVLFYIQLNFFIFCGYVFVQLLMLVIVWTSVYQQYWRDEGICWIKLRGDDVINRALHANSCAYVIFVA